MLAYKLIIDVFLVGSSCILVLEVLHKPVLSALLYCRGASDWAKNKSNKYKALGLFDLRFFSARFDLFDLLCNQRLNLFDLICV